MRRFVEMDDDDARVHLDRNCLYRGLRPSSPPSNLVSLDFSLSGLLGGEIIKRARVALVDTVLIGCC